MKRPIGQPEAEEKGKPWNYIYGRCAAGLDCKFKSEHHCTVRLSPLIGINRSLEPNLFNCPHSEAVSSFQSKYAQMRSLNFE